MRPGKERERERERKRDRDRERERDTDRQTQTERQSERHAQTHPLRFGFTSHPFKDGNMDKEHCLSSSAHFTLALLMHLNRVLTSLALAVVSLAAFPREREAQQNLSVE